MVYIHPVLQPILEEILVDATHLSGKYTLSNNVLNFRLLTIICLTLTYMKFSTKIFGCPNDFFSTVLVMIMPRFPADLNS